MRQIFNALLKYKNTSLFLGLLFISLLIVNQRSFYHKSVFSKIGLGISSYFYGVSKGVSDYFNLRKTNEDLVKENNKLKALELIYFQNQVLKQKTLDTFDFEVLSTKIIKNSFNKANNFVEMLLYEQIKCVAIGCGVAKCFLGMDISSVNDTVKIVKESVLGVGIYPNTCSNQPLEECFGHSHALVLDTRIG